MGPVLLRGLSLTGRTQTVTVDGQSSRPADVTFRVPWAQFLAPSSSCLLHPTLFKTGLVVANVVY